VCGRCASRLESDGESGRGRDVGAGWRCWHSVWGRHVCDTLVVKALENQLLGLSCCWSANREPRMCVFSSRYVEDWRHDARL
jgi:hypothetical protein